ncbi:MAG: alpha/beta hydrolase [Gammaproteobacteria bacterium]|nr:alpha/beta hydrolase [Gammaproteobacteria bacterium]
MKFLKRVGLGVLVSALLLWGGLMAWAYWPAQTEVSVASLTTAEDRFVTVYGVRLRYREWGEASADRPAVLLIHGFGNSLQSFRELAPRLADCCHVIAIDMPGYGLSDKPVDFDYHNGPQAKVLIAAAKEIGLQRVIYVGHSLGGAVALQAAVLDLNARGLVLLNPGIIRTGVPKIVQITLPPLPRMSAKMFASRDFRGNFLKQSYVDPSIVTEKVIDDVMLGARTEGYMTGMTSLMKQYREGEEIALASQVKVPTLILWGDQDKNKPLSEADELQAMIPGSRLVHFANAGHYVHEEAADGVAQAIKLWLQETVASATLVSP